MEPIVINPRRILRHIRDHHGVPIRAEFVDMSYSPELDTLSIRLVEEPRGEVDAVDEDEVVLVQFDDGTPTSVQILELHLFLEKIKDLIE